MTNNIPAQLGKNYWSYLIGRFISQFCTGAMMLGISVWIIQTMENGGAKAAFFMAPSFFIAIFLPPLLAPLADRICKRKIMIYTDLVSFLPVALVLVLSYQQTLSYWSLCLLFWGYSVIRSLFNSASNSILPQLVIPQNLAKAQIYLQAALSAIMVTSGLLGAYLASIFELWQLIACALFGLFVSLISVFFIHIPPLEKQSESASEGAEGTQSRDAEPVKYGFAQWWQDLTDGWHYIKRVRIVWQLIWLLALINILVGPLAYLLEVNVLRDMQLTAQELGYTLVGSAVGIFIATLLYRFAQSFFKSWRKLVLCLAITAPAFLLAGWFNTLPALVSICVILGVTYTLINVPINVLIMSATAPEYQARVLNLTGFCVGISQPIAMMAYGVLLEAISVADLFIIMAAMIAISIPLLWHNRLLAKSMQVKVEDVRKWSVRLYG